jgi:hypothetical protein
MQADNEVSRRGRTQTVANNHVTALPQKSYRPSPGIGSQRTGLFSWTVVHAVAEMGKTRGEAVQGTWSRERDKKSGEL